MITVFSCPKPFIGVTAAHQYNAIGSWTRLHRDAQVILIGNEEGVEKASAECGSDHIPGCERNEFGTPLVSSIFALARETARHDILCYVNADIILTSSFLACLKVAQGKDRFLLVGRRWDFDLNTRLNFEQPHWEADLMSRVGVLGKRASVWQIDYFVFPKSEYSDIPPFAVGRVRWDNWMIWNATANKIAVIDASDFITAIHQNHDYSHYPQGRQGVWEGPEASRNHELAGGWPHIYSIADASHKIRGLDGRPLPYLFPHVLSRIRPRVTRFGREVKRLQAYMTFKNTILMVFRGEWRSIWAKLAEKLNGRRD